jgi:hypothetical protein
MMKKPIIKNAFFLVSALLLTLFSFLPAHAAYTGLIIDARSVALERSMSPKIFNESGQEIYGTLPTNASAAMMEKQSFFYAFDMNQALGQASDRTGSNPLTITAVGAKMDDIYISNSDAALILKEERTGRFLAAQNVVVLISAGQVKDPSVPASAASGSHTLNSLQERLEQIRNRRINPDTTAAYIPKSDRPFTQHQEPEYPMDTADTIPNDAAVRIVSDSPSGTDDLTGPDTSLEPKLASIVKIRKNKVRLQCLDSSEGLRENSKLRVYRSILKSQPVGWIKVLYAQGNDIEARIIEGETKIQLGDYVDLSEVNTIDSFLDKFK